MGKNNYCRCCGSHRLSIIHFEGVTYYACMNCPQGWHVEETKTIQVAMV